ncbi:MAG: endonuclease/exonuclease/phosphatase family protein, partial [Gemmatimonadaceae bacterium]
MKLLTKIFGQPSRDGSIVRNGLVRPSNIRSSLTALPAKQSLTAVALCAGMLGCASAKPKPLAGDTPDARVLVYNIHAGKTVHGVASIEQISALIRSTNADIVLLQEVDKGTKRSGNVDQPAALAAQTGFHVAFGSALDYDGGKYGVAILSRWPILSDTLFHLPVEPPQTRSGGSMEPRGALRAMIKSPYGTLAVINTHLDASGEDRWRKQEADSIVSLVAQTRRSVGLVIAGGDFNSTPESAVQVKLRASGLRDSWNECGSGDGLSYPDSVPAKRIDYLFMTGGNRCRAAHVVESRASDHRPVFFEVSLRTDAQAHAVAAGNASNLDPRTPLTKKQNEWVERTLAAMSLRERVGQMVNVWVLGDYSNTNDSSFAEVLRWIKNDHVGGVTMSLGSPIEVAEKINAMQRASKTPLMFGSDL